MKKRNLMRRAIYSLLAGVVLITSLGTTARAEDLPL